MLTSWEPCTQINSLSASVSGKSQRHSTIRRPVDIEKKPCEAQSMAIPRCSHHIKATTHAENQLAGLSVREEPASLNHLETSRCRIEAMRRAKHVDTRCSPQASWFILKPTGFLFLLRCLRFPTLVVEGSSPNTAGCIAATWPWGP